jgi:hypothetical protein
MIGTDSTFMFHHAQTWTFFAIVEMFNLSQTSYAMDALLAVQVMDY